MKLIMTDRYKERYFKKIKGQIFKILPVFEGRDEETREIVFSKEKAMENYNAYIEKIECSMIGFSNNIGEDEDYDMDIFKEIIFNISGLKEKKDHRSVKSIVLKSVKLVEKVKREG